MADTGFLYHAASTRAPSIRVLSDVSAIAAGVVLACSLPSRCAAQVADDGDVGFDAPARVVEAPPTVPMDPDLWRVALAQRSLYESVFDAPWRWDDFTLIADRPMLDQFAEASGVTTGGEAFGVSVEFVSVFDWEHMVWGGEPLTPQELALIDSLDLRMSYVWGHLTGPAGSAPFGGLAASFVRDGIEYHKLYPWMKLTPEEAEAVAFAAEFRGWPVCNLPFDQEYSTCMSLSDANFLCRVEKLKKSAWVDGGIGIGTALCCATIPIPNPFSTPCCVVGTGVFFLGAACLTIELHAANVDHGNSINCCCVSLECRIGGGGNCPNPTDCNKEGCPTPCVP